MFLVIFIESEHMIKDRVLYVLLYYWILKQVIRQAQKYSYLHLC